MFSTPPGMDRRRLIQLTGADVTLLATASLLIPSQPILKP